MLVGADRDPGRPDEEHLAEVRKPDHSQEDPGQGTVQVSRAEEQRSDEREGPGQRLGGQSNPGRRDERVAPAGAILRKEPERKRKRHHERQDRGHPQLRQPEQP